MTHSTEVSPENSTPAETGAAASSDRLRSLRGVLRASVRPLGVLAATLLGCQALAASTAPQSAVLALLPDHASGARSAFLKGFALGQAEARDCGIDPVSVDWRTVGSDQDVALAPGSATALLVAPFSADLRSFARIAQEQKLGVLLPYQRGDSLKSLAELDPEGRLHPVLPPLQVDLTQLASDTLDQGWRRVMVVADPGDRSADQAQDFVEAFEGLGGRVESFDTQVVQMVAPDDQDALDQFLQDVSWKGPDAIVLAAAPEGDLARRLARAQEQGDFVLSSAMPPWVWMLPKHRVGNLAERPWNQLVLDQSAHGPGWSAFRERFVERYGQDPDLIAASGFDSARMLSLASLAPPPVSSEGTRDPLGWMDADQDPTSMCASVQARLEGRSVRLQGAASDLIQRPGQAPSGVASTRLIAGR